MPSAVDRAHNEEDTLLALRLHDGQDDEPARIREAQAGDASAQAWLVERWTPPIFRFARRMLNSDEDAADAAQDTLVKVLKHLDRYDNDRSFKTWVFQVARNTCIDLHRRRSRRAWDEPGDIADIADSPAAMAWQQQRAEQLNAAIDQLAPLYREVLVLYHFEHLKYQEIAETLGIPLGTVMNRIFRARQKLRAAYEALGGEA